MNYVIFAKKFGKPNQTYYKFFVKHKKTNYVFDKLGWCRFFQFSRVDSSFPYKQFFFCLNIKRLSFWCTKNLTFNKKAIELLFSSGFLSRWKNK